MFVFLIIVVALFCLWHGGQETYQWVRFHEPSRITYTEFVQKSPHDGHFKIEGVRWNDTESDVMMINGTRTGRLYTPVFPKDDLLGSGAVRILLRQDRTPEPFGSYLEARARTTDHTDDNLLEVHAKSEHAGDLEVWVNRPASDQDADIEPLLKDFNLKDKKDAVVVSQGEGPDLTTGLGFLGAGLAIPLSFYVLGTILQERDKKKLAAAG